MTSVLLDLGDKEEFARVYQAFMAAMEPLRGMEGFDQLPIVDTKNAKVWTDTQERLLDPVTVAHMQKKGRAAAIKEHTEGIIKDRGLAGDEAEEYRKARAAELVELEIEIGDLEAQLVARKEAKLREYAEREAELAAEAAARLAVDGAIEDLARAAITETGDFEDMPPLEPVISSTPTDGTATA